MPKSLVFHLTECFYWNGKYNWTTITSWQSPIPAYNFSVLFLNIHTYVHGICTKKKLSKKKNSRKNREGKKLIYITLHFIHYKAICSKNILCGFYPIIHIIYAILNTLYGILSAVYIKRDFQKRFLWYNLLPNSIKYFKWQFSLSFYTLIHSYFSIYLFLPSVFSDWISYFFPFF